MQTTRELKARPAVRTVSSSKKQSRVPTEPSARLASDQAAREIDSYIAIRDSLLTEAKKTPTAANLNRLTIANDFVETCVKPARSPYEAQHLAEADATRERTRCAAVKELIAKLRAQIGAGRLHRAHAA